MTLDITSKKHIYYDLTSLSTTETELPKPEL
jgi:hypothetical protein